MYCRFGVILFLFYGAPGGRFLLKNIAANEEKK
jgi:hypothetical protein